MDRRKRAVLFYSAAALSGFFIIAMSPFLFVSHPVAGEVDPVRVGAFTIAMSIGILWASWCLLRIRRTSDEFMLWLDKESWYRGSIAGLFLSVPIFTFIGTGGLHIVDPGIASSEALKNAFVLGFGLPVMLQTLCTLCARFFFRPGAR